jgi:DNA polymerase-3 subunit delta'
MNFVEQFKNTQPIAYQTIYNGFKDNKLSHAYLLSGSVASPLKETAMLIAKSYLCESKVDYIACGECLNCIRIDNQTYYDLIIIDGSSGSIKKEQIEKIQEEFSKSALEASGKKIYIIHLIENSSSGAVNSLLKFLEEPSEDVLAIITTQNLSKVIPTIISRCQLIRIVDIQKEELIKSLVDDGFSLEDCNILTLLFTNIEEIKKFYQDGDYIKIKDLVVDTLDSWIKSTKRLPYFVQTEVMPALTDKDNLYSYLSILEIALKDVYRCQNKQKIIMVDSKTIIEGLANILEDVNSKIEEVILAKGNLSYNANTGLLMDSLFYKIK